MRACCADGPGLMIDKLPVVGNWNLTNADILAVTAFSSRLAARQNAVSRYIWDRKGVS
jgi:hypothetical protein